MTNEPKISLTDVSSDAVMNEPKMWRDALRTHRESLPNLGHDEQTRILREFLTACVQVGPGSVDHRETRNILETISFLLKSGVIGENSLLSLTELTAQVLRRPDLDPKLEVIAELKSFLPAVTNFSISPSMGRNQSDPPTSISGIDLPAELASLIAPAVDDEIVTIEELSRKWLQSARQSADAKTRTSVDLFLLRTAITARAVAAIEFVHELYLSEDFWSSEMVQDWSSNIGTPISSEGFGEVCAAMVNTRLRSIIPRRFLKHPDSLVIDAIARGDEIRKLEISFREEFAIQTMHALFRVDEALSRDRLLKKPLLDLRKSLQNSLTRYATRLIGEVGSVVTYDPETHLSPNPLAKGDDVLIIQMGLKSLETDLVIQPIKVVPVDHRIREGVTEVE